MKVEYVCYVTLDARDVQLAAANGGTAIEHPVPPVRTVIRTTVECKKPVVPSMDAHLDYLQRRDNG